MSPLAEQYYQKWQTGQPADGLERFLLRHAELNVAQLVEVLLEDQALEWQNGSRPSVEQYLQRFPAIADQQTAVLELVCGEMRATFALGLPVDLDSYIARFPELAEPLRRQTEVAAWLANDGTDTKRECRPRPFA